MAIRGGKALLLGYLTGVVSMLMYMACLLYLVGAIGLFHDSWRTRLVDGFVAAALLAGGKLLQNVSEKLITASRR